MINTIMEWLFEFIIGFLFVFPVAFIRWMFKGFKGSYKNMLEKSDWEVNALIGMMAIGAIIILIVNT